MKAVILAAGEGSRMRPLTYTVPKPLTEVAGKPILTWIMESVKPHVDGIVLIVGHLREKIMEHYGDTWEGIPVSYVHQAEQRGTGHALQICKDALKDTDRFFVIYGDNITAPADVAECAKHPLAALAIRVPDPERYGIFKTDESGNLARMVEKPKEFIGDHANAGVYVFDDRVWELLDNLEESERGELELTDAVLGIAKLSPMKVVDVNGYWLPIGYRDDIPKAEPILLGREPGREEFAAQRKRTIMAMRGMWQRRFNMMVEEVQADKASVAPSEGRMSLIEQLHHMAYAERLFRDVKDTGKMGAEKVTHDDAPDLESAKALWEKERATTLEIIKNLTADELDKVVALPIGGGGQVVYVTIEEMFLANTSHTAWHAGQVSWTARILND